MNLSLNKDTRLCMSLSGRPGNFGTRFHNFLYQELGLNFVYKAFSTSNLPVAIEAIRALGIRGCAISMPFKEGCMEYLNDLDPSARGIQSVNTIVNNEGHLTGYNTDYQAVLHLLKSHDIPTSYSFAILGSGGMAKAVVCASRDCGFKTGRVIARNSKTGPELARQYGYEWQPQMNGQPADLLINASPIGMAGGDLSNSLAFTPKEIEAAKFVFDVVALPSETPLIQHAQALNKPTLSGAEVIVLQAVEQFVLYTGVRPDQKLINKAADFARG